MASMRRRGNCHDNAVAERFFRMSKQEGIKRRLHPARAAASSGAFDCIGRLYAGGVLPVEFERRYAWSGNSASMEL